MIMLPTVLSFHNKRYIFSWRAHIFIWRQVDLKLVKKRKFLSVTLNSYSGNTGAGESICGLPGDGYHTFLQHLGRLSQTLIQLSALP